MRAKAWLVSQGHILKDGRGRMPLKSVKDGQSIPAILESARKSGVTFSDWPKGQIVTTKTDEGKTEITVKRDATTTGEKVVAEIPEYRYTEEDFKAIEIGSKKVRSLREACNNCRVSLVICWCEQPKIVATDGRGSVLVQIVRK